MLYKAPLWKLITKYALAIALLLFGASITIYMAAFCVLLSSLPNMPFSFKLVEAVSIAYLCLTIRSIWLALLCAHKEAWRIDLADKFLQYQTLFNKNELQWADIARIEEVNFALMPKLINGYVISNRAGKKIYLTRNMSNLQTLIEEVKLRCNYSGSKLDFVSAEHNFWKQKAVITWAIATLSLILCGSFFFFDMQRLSQENQNRPAVRADR